MHEVFASREHENPHLLILYIYVSDSWGSCIYCNNALIVCVSYLMPITNVFLCYFVWRHGFPPCESVIPVQAVVVVRHPPPLTQSSWSLSKFHLRFNSLVCGVWTIIHHGGVWMTWNRPFSALSDRALQWSSHLNMGSHQFSFIVTIPIIVKNQPSGLWNYSFKFQNALTLAKDSQPTSLVSWWPCLSCLFFSARMAHFTDLGRELLMQCDKPINKRCKEFFHLANIPSKVLLWVIQFP